VNSVNVSVSIDIVHQQVDPLMRWARYNRANESV